MRRFIFVVSLLCTLPCQAAIYKYVDEKGINHFSDKEQADSIPIKVFSGAENNTLPKAMQKSPEKTRIVTPAGVVAEAYQTLSITSPYNEETIFYDQGKVCVQIKVEPKIYLDHKLRFFLDGNLIRELSAVDNFCIYNVERGEHNLQVKIFSKDGTMLIESSAVKFFMRQPMVKA